MALQKFEVGETYETTGLYGGTLSIEVLSRTETELTYRYTEECSDDRSEMVAEIIRQTAYDPVTLEPSGEIESIEAWEYWPEGLPCEKPEHGYFFAEPVHGFRAGKLLAKHEEVAEVVPPDWQAHAELEQAAEETEDAFAEEVAAG